MTVSHNLIYYISALTPHVIELETCVSFDLAPMNPGSFV